jgi:hypothetical protein
MRRLAGCTAAPGSARGRGTNQRATTGDDTCLGGFFAERVPLGFRRLSALR